jgi:hypothetical protein
MAVGGLVAATSAACVTLMASTKAKQSILLLIASVFTMDGVSRIIQNSY